MSTTTPTHVRLSRRELAMLHAIAAGRAETTTSCEPDLFVDGLACCDQIAAHHLAHDGLMRAAGPAKEGQRVPAELTTPGHVVLAALVSTRRLASRPTWTAENDLPRQPGTGKATKLPSASWPPSPRPPHGYHATNTVQHIADC